MSRMCGCARIRTSNDVQSLVFHDETLFVHCAVERFIQCWLLEHNSMENLTDVNVKDTEKTPYWS